MPLNLKTYTWLKFLATIGSTIFFVDPLLILFKVTKQNKFLEWNTLIAITIPLLVIGLLAIVLYVLLRLHLVKKSTYVYTKKDHLFLKLSLICYLIASLMTIIYVALGLTLQEQKTLSLVFFGITYFFIVVGLIAGSIFESYSRVDEQVHLYKEQEKQVSTAKKAKREALLKNEITEEEIATAVRANRTLAAQKLLAREKKLASQTKKSDYNPFLEESKDDPRKK